MVSMPSVRLTKEKRTEQLKTVEAQKEFRIQGLSLPEFPFRVRARGLHPLRDPGRDDGG
jgi:hypothetical protein